MIYRGSFNEEMLAMRRGVEPLRVYDVKVYLYNLDYGWQTNAIKGLHYNDFIVAAKIEKLEKDY